MRCLSYSFFIAILFIFSSNITKSQASISPDSSALHAAKEYFENEIKEDALLYAGEEYIKYVANIQGHPFFNNDQMHNSEIFYDGILYKNIPLMYDLVRQEVVISNYNKSNRMKLLTEKIKYFTLQGHTFKNFFSIEGSDANVTNTIYDEVFNGKASVLIKRVKYVKIAIRAEDPTSFKQLDEFYIRNGKSLYAVANKNAVIQAFNDKKQLLKIFIRKNRLKYKKNIEKDLVMTAAYYSTLN